MFLYVQIFPLVSSRFITIQMCASQLFLSVDPSLGKVDYSLMSDQTLMEMLIEGFDTESKKKYQDTDGMYLDVCTWPWVICDDNERVIGIRITRFYLYGSLELCYVPPKVKVLAICVLGKSGLTESIDLTRVPDGMEELDLRSHKLTGEVDLTQLPDGMERLYLNNNQLTGGIDLTQLPSGMQMLYLDDNQFTGEVDLTRMPEGMVWLYLNHNQLTGGIDLTHLPAGMGHIYLSNNRLSGEIDLTELPDGMVGLYLENNHLSGSLVIKKLTHEIYIDARRNRFNAVAVVDSETDATIKLEGSGVTSVVDGNGGELDMKRFLG